MADPPASPSGYLAEEEGHATELDSVLLSLHWLRNRMGMGINAEHPVQQILSELLDAVLRHGLARFSLLTLKPWAERSPELLAAKPSDIAAWWPSLNGKHQIERAHSGRRVAWGTEIGDPPKREDCFSFCFSTNGRGAIALTGIGSPRPPEMYQLKAFLSPDVERLLVRDRILKAKADDPVRPLRDMAEWTWLTLDATNEALEQIDAHSVGSPERLVAESSLRMKIQELCHYTHIDDGLAEVSSSLLVVTHEAHPGPLSQANVEALRDVFGWMRAIALSDEDSERCLDRLEEGGLDIFDAFGEDDSGLQHP